MIEEVLSLIDPSAFGLRLFGAVTGAFGVASALSVSIPSVVDKLLPPPIHDELWQYLPFERIHRDRKTIVCANGRYVRALELKGAELTLASEDARERLFHSRKHFFDELEKYGIEHVKIFQVKERVDLKRTLRPRHPLMRDIDESWERSFPSPFMLRHYFMLVAKGRSYADAAGILDPAETFALSTLAEYKPRVMVEPNPDEPLSDDPAERPGGPLKPFAHTISPISRPNPYGSGWRGPLSALVTGDDVDFTDSDKGRVVFRNGDQVRYASIITLRDCGEKTSEAIIRDVMSVDCEMLVYHAAEPISQALAVVSLNRGRSASVGEHLSSNAKESYDQALRQVEGTVADERASLLYYAMHVMPIASTLKELRAAEARIRAVMTRSAGSVVTLQASAQPTLFSTVSFDQIWPRRFRFLSTNIASTVYPQRSEIGMIRSDWLDEPIAWFKTVGGDPYPFHFHAHSGRNAPAHAILIGPTGSGKTSLLTFLASQAMRLERLRIFLLDRLNGMKIFTHCAGGRYVTFDGDESNAALNPFHLPDSPENRKFLQRWLRLLAETTDQDAEQEIARTVSLIYDSELPMAQRSLRAVTKAAFSPTGLVRQNMQIWTDPKAYGGYFNADADTLDLGRNSLVAFNMTDILVDERLAPPMVDYLVHRIKDLSITTTAPSLVLVDESKPMMRNKRFAVDFLQTGLQEGRKLGQAYVLCFQTPQAMVDTGMSQIMLDQCGLQVIFRNPRDSDSAAAQYEMFGLNEAELAFVTGRTFKENRYAVLIRRPHSNESAIVDVDLSRLGRHMGVFESDARQVAVLDGLMADKPRDQAVRMYLDARR